MAIQIRRGTNAEWESNKSNIVAGEPAVATDEGRFFIGTGTGTYAEMSNIENLAEAFDSSTTYAVGDYCTYGGKLYKFTSAHSGAWSSGDVSEVTVTDDLGGEAIAMIGDLSDLTTTAKSDVVSAINEVDGEVANIDYALNGGTTPVDVGTDNHGYYSASNYTLTYNSDSSSHSFIIDLSDYIGESVKVVFNTTNTSSTRVTALCNSERKYVSNDERIYEKDMTQSGFVVTPTATHYYLYISYSSGGSQLSVVATDTGESINHKIDVIENLVANETVFVATNGNDNNDGLSANPLKTVNKALEMGASKILVKSGKYSGQQIDLSKAKHKNITIASFTDNGHAIFYAPESTLATSETKLDGYSKVYYASGSHSFTTNNIWLFQDGIADETTEISSSEVHPLQRGQSYRCLDTKIQKCTSTTLNEALAEIDAYDGYKFFYDSNNARTYFSRPSTVNSSNPICASFGYRFLTNADRSFTLNLIGIETKYYGINVNNTTNSYIVDCKASNVCGEGCFTYDSALGVTFKKCEAGFAFKGSNGDGFNGHGTTTGEDFPKQITASLIECWSHDNNDDGYSDHERSETSIFGGLYEYNGKGGVVPSYGSHCVCHDVLSRGNYNGFYYTGTKLDEGNGGQLVCYNCIAENNKKGGAKTGFLVDGNGNRLILYNCKSISNRKGFDTTSQSHIVLYDCGAYGNEITKDGNVSANNTTIVS